MKKLIHTARKYDVSDSIFQIIAIRIDSRCNGCLRKNLLDEYYLFNNRYRVISGKLQKNDSYNDIVNSIFGSRITVHTIVGKNGSGKSSLLEILYRIINNFSAITERNLRRRAADTIYYVYGLWADLYYLIDSRLMCISCQGEEVKLLEIDDSDSRELLSASINTPKNITQQNLADISMKHLFYSIVSNYSVQSFVWRDYNIEQSLQVNGRNLERPKENAVWLSSLFHKNDGYLTPIVLNPYRDRMGAINMCTENQLTQNRLESIFIYYSKKHKQQFIKDYGLDKIIYTFDIDVVINKYINNHFGYGDSIIEDELRHKLLGIFDIIKEQPLCYASIILRTLGYKGVFNRNSPMQNSACLYLIYKVISIASKYPSYIEYADICKIEKFDQIAEGETEKKLILLVNKIKKDNSHITIKIKQTQSLLDQIIKYPELEQELYYCTEQDYLKYVFAQRKTNGLQKIMEILPPPFFRREIHLRKNSVSIPLSRMSSGEKQYLYMLSTYIYHIRNLLSIQETSRVRYRNINLIFDELEICFHPEYQRQFINSLVTIIKQFGFNKHCSFNIIMATHSPFILSDMPQDNILYLTDGQKALNMNGVNPFAANINDILKNSFFLEHGFIGNFAQKTICLLVEYLTGVRQNSDWTKERAKYFIDNIVGEPIIRHYLQELYEQMDSNR